MAAPVHFSSFFSVKKQVQSYAIRFYDSVGILRECGSRECQFCRPQNFPGSMALRPLPQAPNGFSSTLPCTKP